MKRSVAIFISCALSLRVCAQLAPPGIGPARTASWMAVGFRQVIDSAKTKIIVSYIGLGRLGTTNDNPVARPAIFVMNHEFYHQFARRWQYSLGISYRYQNEYGAREPYTPVGADREFRIYGRITEITRIGRFRLASTFRQEIQKFYTPDYFNWEQIIQYRSRFRVQATARLDNKNIHRLVSSAEALFSDFEDKEHEWSGFTYRESGLLCITPCQDRGRASSST